MSPEIFTISKTASEESFTLDSYRRRYRPSTLAATISPSENPVVTVEESRHLKVLLSLITVVKFTIIDGYSIVSKSILIITIIVDIYVA